jgi:hypothetical protein
MVPLLWTLDKPGGIISFSRLQVVFSTNTGCGSGVLMLVSMIQMILNPLTTAKLKVLEKIGNVLLMIEYIPSRLAKLHLDNILPQDSLRAMELRKEWERVR